MVKNYKECGSELEEFIISNVGKVPSCNEGIVECVIRLLKERNSYAEDIEDLSIALGCWEGSSDVWERVENWLFNCKRHVLDISPVSTEPML